MAEELNYWQEAERCLDAANAAHSPDKRALFLTMAQIWVRLAKKQSEFRDEKRRILRALQEARGH